MADSLEVKPRYQEQHSAGGAQNTQAAQTVQSAQTVQALSKTATLFGIEGKYIVIFIVVCILLIGVVAYVFWPKEKTTVDTRPQQGGGTAAPQHSNNSAQNVAQSTSQSAAQAEQKQQPDATKPTDKIALMKLLERSKAADASARVSTSEDEIMKMMESDDPVAQCSVDEVGKNSDDNDAKPAQ